MAKIIIIGEMPCCICNVEISQADVEDCIFASSTGSFFPFEGVIAHVDHFYQKDELGVLQETSNYKLNMDKFALAYALEMGGLEPEREKLWRTKIQEMEKLLYENNS